MILEIKKFNSLKDLKGFVRDVKIQCIEDDSDEPLFRFYINGIEQTIEEIRTEYFGFTLEDTDELSVRYVKHKFPHEKF